MWARTHPTNGQKNDLNRTSAAKAFVLRPSNVAAGQVAEIRVFRPSGVKTPEEKAAFMSCLKARPTKLKSFSASCGVEHPGPAGAATHKDQKIICRIPSTCRI